MEEIKPEVIVEAPVVEEVSVSEVVEEVVAEIVPENLNG